MAIWRRKLVVPTSLRLRYGDAIRQKKDEIEQREMVIRIDEHVSQAVFLSSPHLSTALLHLSREPGPVNPKKRPRQKRNGSVGQINLNRMDL